MPVPGSCLNRSVRIATILLLAALLLCCPAVSAIDKVVVVKPVATLVTVGTAATTSPTPTPVQTIACEAPAECLSTAEATAKWGTGGYTQTAEQYCSYIPANAAPLVKYCYRQKPVTLQTLAPRTIATLITAETYVTETPTGKVTALQVTPLHADTAGMKPVTCGAGEAVCNGTCTSIRGSDARNCGGCGWTCPAGLSCIQGECAAACQNGFIECQPGQCVDAQNDDDNCGTCGNRCGNRQHCRDGKCISLCDISPSHFTTFSWADWKGINWMTPVKDQAACGSCWAEASTGVAEAMFNIENNYWYPYGYNLNLSEQALVSGCYGDLGSCTGGDHSAALDVLKTDGVAEDTYMPYQSLDCVHKNADEITVCNDNIAGHCSIPGSCTLSNVPQDRIWKITSATVVGTANMWTDEDAYTLVKKSILCNGPQTACSGNWWHCVDIVGWQNNGWIVRNSWGTGWGTNGIGVIYYGKPVSGDDKDEQLAGDIVFDSWSVKGVHHG